MGRYHFGPTTAADQDEHDGGMPLELCSRNSFSMSGAKDGLLIFKHLMQYGLQTAWYGSEMTKEKLHSLNVKNFINNVEEMLLHRKTLLDDIQAQVEVIHEDFF